MPDKDAKVCDVSDMSLNIRENVMLVRNHQPAVMEGENSLFLIVGVMHVNLGEIC